MPMDRLQQLLAFYSAVESKSVNKDNTLELSTEEKGFLNKIQSKEEECALNKNFLVRDFSLRANANMTEAEQDSVYQ